MTLDTDKFTAIVETAKQKAANDPKWLRAIEKAAAGILDGSLIVTVLQDGALVTSANGSYRVKDGRCNCHAAHYGHRECYHRCAARLVEMMERAPAVSVRVPTITCSVERDRTGQHYTVVRCDGWAI